jgi:hypothetical protein
LQPFGPTGDDLIQRKADGLAARDGTVEHSAVETTFAPIKMAASRRRRVTKRLQTGSAALFNLYLF